MTTDDRPDPADGSEGEGGRNEGGIGIAGGRVEGGDPAGSPEVTSRRRLLRSVGASVVAVGVAGCTGDGGGGDDGGDTAAGTTAGSTTTPTATTTAPTTSEPTPTTAEGTPTPTETTTTETTTTETTTTTTALTPPENGRVVEVETFDGTARRAALGRLEGSEASAVLDEVAADDTRRELDRMIRDRGFRLESRTAHSVETQRATGKLGVDYYRTEPQGLTWKAYNVVGLRENSPLSITSGTSVAVFERPSAIKFIWHVFLGGAVFEVKVSTTTEEFPSLFGCSFEEFGLLCTATYLGLGHVDERLIPAVVDDGLAPAVGEEIAATGGSTASSWWDCFRNCIQGRDPNSDCARGCKDECVNGSWTACKDCLADCVDDVGDIVACWWECTTGL